MPVQNTNLSEKTPLIYPADSPGGSLPVHDENDQDAFDASNALLADGVVSKTVDLDSLPDVTENWTFINRLFYIAYFPFSIWFIMVNEALERFSFYGLRVLLPNYLANTPQFHLDQDKALSIISIFSSAAYITPILGSFLADMLIGKYWTITLLSLIYCLGGVVTAVTAIPSILDKVGIAGIILGLALIALGTGGIKSSVSSFAADQFAPRKGDRVSKMSLLTSFFTIFYLSVNIGSTASVIITPIVRNYFSYWAAFMIPAVLLFVGTLVFAVGKFNYQHVKPGGFILWKAFRCFVSAIINLNSEQYKNLSKWNFLGHAEHVYGPEFIDDLRAALRVIMYLPPILFFFSLSDLSSAIWIYQANLMNRSFFGSKQLSSDQLAFLNPVIIIIMAPTLDRVVYPIVNKFIRVTPLRKMYVGFVFTALAMTMSGILEIFVELHPQRVHVLFQIPQYFIMCLGELLIAISSMDFAYQEAPTSMKSMMQATFLAYISFGDLNNLLMINIMSPIPIFQAEKTQFADAYRMFVFAFEMCLGLVYFFLTTFRYKYKKERDAEKKEALKDAIMEADASKSIQAVEVE